MDELIRFQTDRGLDQQPYSPLNEHTSIVEELLESIGLDVPKENRPALTAAWEDFLIHLIKSNIAVASDTQLSGSDQADAYADIITLATGALLKLGYDPKLAIEQCGLEINSRVGEIIDGKFQKDLSPEAQANWIKADYSLCQIT